MPAPQTARVANDTVDACALYAVNKAIAELRRGDLVAVRDRDGHQILVCAAEGITEERLRRVGVLSGSSPLLVITRHRALALNAATVTGDENSLVALRLDGCVSAQVAALADPAAPLAEAAPQGRLTASLSAVSLPGELDRIAVDLMKLAGLLPAAIAGLWSAPGSAGTASGQDIPVFDADDVARYRQAQALSLREVSSARVPLALAEDSRIVVFRTADGVAEHFAIVVGQPEPGGPVLTRLHSQCMTGDLLGSLRCDCGEQLHAAMAAMAEAGSGVLLYLAQEGRGIGLANKMRAYALQDRGADTVEANHQLGFDADERLYLSAAVMLQLLGVTQVRLLTNNPRKLDGLAACGIDVSERVPLVIDSNAFNAGYLAAKARRLGHML